LLETTQLETRDLKDDDYPSGRILKLRRLLGLYSSVKKYGMDVKLLFFAKVENGKPRNNGVYSRYGTHTECAVVISEGRIRSLESNHGHPDE
jgi:hypothetical protein